LRERTPGSSTRIAFLRRPQDHDLPERVIEQPGDVVIVEAVTLRCRRGDDDAVVRLVGDGLAERVAAVAAALDARVDRHAVLGGTLLDRLKQRDSHAALAA
jgi:hypothetical protein